MTRRYEDFREDDAFDENGLLRDGHKIRVRLAMRDAMTPLQREVATKRLLADASVNDARETAYQEYLSDLTNAWRTKPPRL